MEAIRPVTFAVNYRGQVERYRRESALGAYYGRQRTYTRPAPSGLSSEKRNIGIEQQMAKYKYKYKKAGKRGNRKRGIIKPKIPGAIAPRRKMIRARAVNYATFTNTSGALDQESIKMLDFADPFATGGAGQPLGYDQWKALYNKGVVIGSKVVVRFHNPSTVAVMVGITPVSDSAINTSFDNYEHYMEAKGTKTRVLSPDVDHVTMFTKYSTKKFYGLNDIMDDISYHVTDLASETGPAIDGRYRVWCQPMDQSSTPSAAVQAVITAEYVILLHDPIVPSRSVET